MRKITDLAVYAFENEHNFKSGNTEVRRGLAGFNDYLVAMFLHGNKIAWKDERGALWISNCGWQTDTTKERLNGLTWVNIKQVKGVWFLNGKEWSGTAIKINDWK